MPSFLKKLFFVLLLNLMLCAAHATAIADTTNNTVNNTVHTEKIDPRLRQLLSDAVNDSASFDDRFHAEVWLLDMSNRLQRFIKNKKLRLELLKQIHRESTRAKLQPELVLALIEIESHFDSYAISRAGAQGLMQVMPFWLKEIGHPDDNLIEIKTNLRMGCTILKYYMDMENNDLHKALARYNGSRGSRVYSDKVLKVLNQHWFQS